MATGTNSRSDATVTFTFRPPSPGDCFTDKQAREIERRLLGRIPTQSTVGDAIVSRTPPEDKTKIWYLANENGIPTGEQFRYNTSTQQWESTEQSIPPIPCRSSNTSNLITTDNQGCWQVDRNTIVSIAQDSSLTISTDPGNAIGTGADGGLFLPFSFFCVSEVTGQINFIKRTDNDCLRSFPSSDTGNALVAGADGNPMVPLPKVLDSTITMLSGANPAGSINVASFATIPTWATHAIIYQPNGKMFLKLAGGFITHDAILVNQSIILAGFIRAQP